MNVANKMADNIFYSLPPMLFCIVGDAGSCGRESEKVWKDVSSSPSGDYLENLALKWCDKERHKIWDLNLSNTNFIVIVSVSISFRRTKSRINKCQPILVQGLRRDF